MVGKIALVIGLLAAAACGPALGDYSQEDLVLTERGEAVASRELEESDKVTLVIEATQRDEWAWCARPTLEDPHGNPLMELRASRTGAGDSQMDNYRYDFTAQADGVYRVVFDNAECAVRMSVVRVAMSWSVS